MSNFRNVNDDLLKDWLYFREDTLCCNLTAEDKNHNINFDEISAKILNSIPKKNRNFVRNQLNLIDENFLDYIIYWNEKYYRNGFCDGIELLNGCLMK